MLLATFWPAYAVWRRHLAVYRQTWLVNCLPPISEPIVYLLAFGLGFTPMVNELLYLGVAIDYPRFLAPGMIAVGLLFQSFFEGAYGSFIRLNYQRTWQAMLTTPLTFRDVFIGDWLWAATRGLIAGLLTAAVTIALGLYSIQGLLVALPMLVVGGLLFAAVGLYTAGLVKTIDQVNVPVFLLIVPMFVLCGTYFPRDNLPQWLKILTDLLPLSTLVDTLRWPLGLPTTWIWQVLWLGVLLIVMTGLAARQLWRKLY